MNQKMESQTQSLSTDTETEGFDLQSGETWFYPTNYPIRDYQYNIIQEALFKNTLVSLPTGLGKTFIAAVVMYNFYRWYPGGKVIFMAPTRPLVRQQIEACYNIMAIPENVTAKLTGTRPSASRSNMWLSKRVFFVTPHVLQNDLETVTQLGGKIKCLVFDEAHKARGNHAYCQVIRKLTSSNHKYFRVLALSATPGGSVKDVTEVAQNLLISHLEFRTEESLDVMKYVFQRSLETLVVHLDDKLVEVRDEYLKIIEYYARTLLKYNILQGNCGSLTKGKIFMLMKHFQNKTRGSNSSNYSEIMRCLNICVTLYHALELLIRHGLRNFLSFFDEHIEKPLLRGNTQLRAILENVRNYLGPIPNIEVLPDGTYPKIPDNIKFGHPKHYKLREILTAHFSDEKKKDTRVIVFFEYRESVMEAHMLLLQSRPLIQPKIFLGKGSGITQKTQLGVVKAFKEGKCNTLLSTCIGEEGLDVGEVDLIVCFDISSKSPIRMVQRMGRTGRKRAGSIVVLVTEGREQQTLKDCLIHKNNMSTQVLGSVHLKNALHTYSPRLIPKHIEPRCVKMFITVKTEKKNTIIKKLIKPSSDSPKITCIKDYENYKFEDRIPETKMKFFLYSVPTKSESPNLFFNKHIDKMRTLQKFYQIGHSVGSQNLTDLLCYADSKRFNIPSGAQGSIKASDIRGKSLKQSDIRNMFKSGKRNNIVTETVIDLTQSQVTSQANSQIQKNDTTVLPISWSSNDLFKMLSNYLMADITTNLFKCTICPKNFDCSQFVLEPPQLKTSNESATLVSIPSDAVVNKITLENIEDLIATIDCNFYFGFDKDMVDSDSSTPIESCEADKPSGSSISFFEAPKSYSSVLNKINHSNFDSQSGDQAAFGGNKKPQEITNEKLLDFFRFDFDTNQDITETALLEFFNLKSYRDIFASDKSSNSSQDTIIYSADAHLLDVAICDSLLEEEMPNHLVDLCEIPKKMLRSCGQSELEVEVDNQTKPSPIKLPHDISELCDLSFFGLSDFHKPELPFNTTEKSKKRSLNESVTVTQMVEILQKPTSVKSVNPRSGKSLDEFKNTNIIDLTQYDTDDDSFLTNIVSQKGSRKKFETSITKDLNSSKLLQPIKPKIMNSPSTSKEARQNTSIAFPNKFKDVPGSSKIIQKHVSSDDSLEDFSIDDVKQSSKAKLIRSPLSPAVRSFVGKRHVGRKKLEVKEAKKQAKAFMCLEAVVSDEDNVIVSEDEEETGPNVYDGSFVNDKTLNVDTQMHAVYLRSIRSPAYHKALQKHLPVVNVADVYSQYPIQEDNEYVNDSFCVGEDEDVVTEQSQLSQLDILELQLKEKKRRKKSAKSNSSRAKRKRIKYMPSDDSD
ncbi:Fanconi anemia group M protein [Euwallacea similis]|uniref:Fanconi anemia group M protein n=1 Tax=Euwallacea similis TaxID=1736056 RepID=UPI00344BD2B4